MTVWSVPTGGTLPMRTTAGQAAPDEGWTHRFDGLARLKPGVRERLVGSASLRRFPSGHVLFGPGRPPTDLNLLLEGRVRVQQTFEGGREIVLYRVHAGES